MCEEGAGREWTDCGKLESWCGSSRDVAAGGSGRTGADEKELNVGEGVESGGPVVLASSPKLDRIWPVPFPIAGAVKLNGSALADARAWDKTREGDGFLSNCLQVLVDRGIGGRMTTDGNSEAGGG